MGAVAIGRPLNERAAFPVGATVVWRPGEWSRGWRGSSVSWGGVWACSLERRARATAAPNECLAPSGPEVSVE